MNGWFLGAVLFMTNCNANLTNSIAKLTNSIANRTNSVAKPTNSIANGTNSIAMATNSIAKTCNGVSLDSVNCHKDLSIIFDANFKFNQHASEVAMKANRVLFCMKRSFIDLKEFVLSRLYKSIV